MPYNTQILENEEVAWNIREFVRREFSPYLKSDGLNEKRGKKSSEKFREQKEAYISGLTALTRLTGA